MSDVCVLAVDYQVCEKRKEKHPLSWEIICENTNRLLTIARSINALVVHCLYVPDYISNLTQVHHPHQFDGRSIKIKNNDHELLLECSDHWREARLEKGISRCKSDRLLVKPDKDAFEGTNLCAKLKRRRIKNVIVTGFQADDCVISTTIGADWSGFNTCIVRDCINNSKTFKTNVITVITLTEILAILESKRESIVYCK